jgi:hypothetical protein
MPCQPSSAESAPGISSRRLHKNIRKGGAFLHGRNQQSVQKEPSTQAQILGIRLMAPGFQELRYDRRAGMLQAAGHMWRGLLPRFRWFTARKSKGATELFGEFELICRPALEITQVQVQIAIR